MSFLASGIIPVKGVVLRNRDDKGKVLRIVEEKDAGPEEKNIKEVNIGTYCFRKADIKRFINEIKINEKKKVKKMFMLF